MPRAARETSESGYYHVMLRGIGRQLLFESDVEMQQFLAIVKRYRDQFGVRIIAWCLMSNHVHILVESLGHPPSEVVKRVALSFAQQHNCSTGHVGHVFQDRFRSKPVETDEQLLACVCYIHDNPEKAHICRVDEYPWSSYHEYLGRVDSQCGPIADTTLVLDMLGGRRQFIEFSHGKAQPWTEPLGMKRVDDLAARRLLEELLDESGRWAIEQGDKASRDYALAKLKAAGLSIRQIERLTGIGRNVVQRAKVSSEPSEPSL